MAVFVNKEDELNNELSRRISADLRARQQAEESGDKTDFTDDTEYVKDTKKTGRFAWVWFVLIGLAIISVIIIATPLGG